MFRHHMTQFGSCASEVHKTLCYFFAALNIFLAMDMLADFSSVWFDALDESGGERFQGVTDAEASKMAMGLIIIGPAIANVCLAVMLIIGVYKRRPTYIRVFRLFILAQVVVICFLAIFSYSIVLEHRGSHTIMLFVLVISIALFGAEAWIAGDYHKLLLEEMLLEETDCPRIA
uniref:Putative secreted protein n=1 Tax=Aedes albopictus TaxID=7160 RepID=A0A023EI35_AEDAL